MFQLGDGLLDLGPHFIPPLLEGSAVHGHGLEGLCGLLGPTVLIHQVLGGGSELISAGVI